MIPKHTVFDNIRVDPSENAFLISLTRPLPFFSSIEKIISPFCFTLRQFVKVSLIEMYYYDAKVVFFFLLGKKDQNVPLIPSSMENRLYNEHLSQTPQNIIKQKKENSIS